MSSSIKEVLDQVLEAERVDDAAFEVWHSVTVRGDAADSLIVAFKLINKLLHEERITVHEARELLAALAGLVKS